MNYEQARQIGPGGPAPGKWNWTNMNDRRVSTTTPCYYPDFDWAGQRILQDIAEGLRIEPTGRERCDHDTQEEAERHHYDYELSRVKLVKIDLTTARQQNRCDVPECPNWANWEAVWPGGYVRDSLCQEHYNESPTLHPFRSGVQVIHS